MANKRHSLTELIYAACREAVLGHGGDIGIGPAAVASEAMKTLDKKAAAPVVVAWGCNLQCRHAARDILRHKFDPTDEEDTDDTVEQHPLFPDLQTRYPTKRGGGRDSEYILLEHLTDAEIDYNATRMERSANKLLHHRDSLIAYKESRREESSG